MSNLGMYQKIVEWSKKVGGPGFFIAIVAISGYGVIRLSEAAIKRFGKAIVNYKRRGLDNNHKTYVIKDDGVSNEGVEFHSGDKVQIIEQDGDVLLVVRIGDDNSPYCLAAEFLKSISDYK